MKKNVLFAGILIIFSFTLFNLNACSPSSEETKKIKAADSGQSSIGAATESAQKETGPAGGISQGAPSAGGQSSSVQSPPSAQSPETVMVRVDDVVLTKGQLDTEVKNNITALGSKIPSEKLAEARQAIRRQVVDDFIVRTLLEKEVKRLNIPASDKETNDAVAELKKTLPPGVTLEAMVKKNNISMARLRQEVAMGIRINKLVARQPAVKAKPTEKEMAAFYKNNPDKFKVPEMVHARHILIAKTPGEDESARAKKKGKAEQIRQKLLNGADFAETAKTDSDCPSKNSGGDLGAFPKGQMVKPFEEAAFQQKKNEIGPIVETDFGYHIIQVLDHIKAKTQPLDKSVKAKISTHLEQQKRYRAFNELMSALKSQANIIVAKEID